MGFLRNLVFQTLDYQYFTKKIQKNRFFYTKMFIYTFDTLLGCNQTLNKFHNDNF